ncbi:MAG: ATPase, T2SS/T4P/T4SS family [Candidatus Ranarchaeia archaeon]
MPLLLNTQPQIEVDRDTRTLNIEGDEGVSEGFGDFGRDSGFRRFLLETLSRLSSKNIEQILVRVGTKRYYYGKDIVKKLKRHVETIEKLAKIAERNGREGSLRELLKGIDSEVLFQNIFSFYLKILFLRKRKDETPIDQIYKILNSDPFINDFLKLYKGDQNRPLTHFYGLIVPFQRYGKVELPAPDPNLIEKERDSYFVGPFSICIFERSGVILEKKYVSRMRDSGRYSDVTKGLLSQLELEYTPVPKCSFKELQQNIESLAENLIRRKSSSLSSEKVKEYAKVISYERLGFLKLLPVLLDDKVNEIFLDGPGHALYLDHSMWGRCRTNIVLSPTDLDKIMTRLRLESANTLDRLNPSLKTELIASDFRTRVSLDIPPLAVNGPYLDIRKFYLRPLSIFDLIRNGTITSEVAAFLLLCVQNRFNIVAIGNPGSGKTTLINALDLLTPSNWRKVAIEDTIEGVNQAALGRHQIQLQVGGGFWENTRKTTEIVKLLHRMPDYLFLGEIQTKEHSQALFHALNAGLKGIQTCHASSPEGILLRWVYHHDVPISSIGAIDIIVQMKQNIDNSARRVARISEVSTSNLTDVLKGQMPVTSLINDLFVFSYSKDSLERTRNLYRSEVFLRLQSESGLDAERIKKTLSKYKAFFNSNLNSMSRLVDINIVVDRLYEEYIQLRRDQDPSLFCFGGGS